VKQKQERIVPEGKGGLRLDVFLAEASGLVRNQVKRLIEDGCVLVNDRVPSKAGLKLEAGARVQFEEPDPEPGELIAQDIPLNILYEDSDLLVLNKPPGLVVHPAAGNRDGTLVNALLFHCGDLQGIGGVIRPGIVHRLDKDTSGAMVVAKNEACLNALQAQFKAHSVRKIYRALAFGTPDPAEGSIKGAIGRHKSDRKRFTVDIDCGKEALTHYKLLARFGEISYIELVLETGRTHQIRVHLAHINHSVVGDPVYAPSKRAAHIRDIALRQRIAKLNRQLLHAYSLSFEHPRSGERLSFTAEMPTDMSELLTWLNEQIKT
jgi:23S rRNA pseudouridine1911/1915/1917 synthase